MHAFLQVYVSALAARRKRFQLLHRLVLAGSSHLLPWIIGEWTSSRVRLVSQLFKQSVSEQSSGTTSQPIFSIFFLSPFFLSGPQVIVVLEKQMGRNRAVCLSMCLYVLLLFFLSPPLYLLLSHHLLIQRYYKQLSLTY